MPEPLDVLIVDDDLGMAETLGDILEAKGYRVRQAFGGRQALAALAERPADVVLLDIKMPEMNGVEVLRRIRERCPAALTLMMTAYALPDLIADAEAEGAVAILAKPLPLDPILGFLARLASTRPILVVEDDPGFRAGLRDVLEAHGFAVAYAADAVEAREALRDLRPDLVLLDLRLPGGSGDELLREIRAANAGAAVLLMTGYAAEYRTEVAQSLREGALACLEKPFALSDMLRHVAGAHAQLAARELHGHGIHDQRNRPGR